MVDASGLVFFPVHIRIDRGRRAVVVRRREEDDPSAVGSQDRETSVEQRQEVAVARGRPCAQDAIAQLEVFDNPDVEDDDCDVGIDLIDPGLPLGRPGGAFRGYWLPDRPVVKGSSGREAAAELSSVPQRATFEVGTVLQSPTERLGD